MFGKEQTIRPPAVAGLFYEGAAHQLKDTIRTYMANVSLPKSVEHEPVRALIVPHAGYMYSGQTAAYAYSLVRNKQYDAVIIVGPSHRKYFRGISLYPGDAYRTPLGDVPIHTELRDEMINEQDRIVLSDEGHQEEHSIEVQLPFLQMILGDFQFVPVVMGDQSRIFVEKLARTLDEVAHRKNILLVASTDLSHYYPYDTAVHMDKKLIESVERFDHNELMSRLENRYVEACGGGPMVAVMNASKLLGCTTSRVLHYCNSGDVSGDRSAVVGYLAASFS